MLFFKWDFAIVGNRNRHSPIVNLKSKGTLANLTVQGEGKVANAAVGEDAESISSSPNHNLNVLVTAKRNPLFI
ncbi:hypothetical protein [Peribacillus frigoritolerans]|uniref:hypothetical protein n=1 Tax=Peribacillus castrilensis TaxID=2897690 RepID=UPI002DC60B14|nr:hypothetical protein [Peribacillus castrilensis]